MQRNFVFPLCISYLGGMLDRRHVYVQRIGRSLPRGLRGCPENHINREDFDPGRTKQKDREISQKNYSVAPAYAHFSNLHLSRTLPIPIFRVIKGKKRSRLCFYTSALLSFSVYNTRATVYVFIPLIRCLLISFSRSLLYVCFSIGLLSYGKLNYHDKKIRQTPVRHTELAVSTLLGLISSVYHNPPNTGDRISDHRTQCRNPTIEPVVHIAHKRCQTK